MREEHVDLDQYELERGPRRCDEELVMDWLLRKRILRCYAGVTEDEIYSQNDECSRIRKQREQTRKRVTSRSSIRHMVAKITGGLLGAKHIKHKDRAVHLKRLETQKADMATSMC